MSDTRSLQSHSRPQNAAPPSNHLPPNRREESKLFFASNPRPFRAPEQSLETPAPYGPPEIPPQPPLRQLQDQPPQQIKGGCRIAKRADPLRVLCSAAPSGPGAAGSGNEIAGNKTTVAPRSESCAANSRACSGARVTTIRRPKSGFVKSVV